MTEDSVKVGYSLSLPISSVLIYHPCSVYVATSSSQFCLTPILLALIYMYLPRYVNGNRQMRPYQVGIPTNDRSHELADLDLIIASSSMPLLFCTSC